MKTLKAIGNLLGLAESSRPKAPGRLIEAVQSLPGVQSGHSITIDRDAAWLHLSSGIDLRFEEKFNSVTDILLRSGAFEGRELELMVRMLRDGAVVVDVGANVGLFALAAAKAGTGITVHAFEPVPETCESLKANVARNGVERQVTINADALSDRDGQAYITTDYHSSNYLTDERSAQRKAGVRVRTLDSYAVECGMKRLDFLKVDVEGRELSVLRGALATIQKFRPAILVEVMEYDSGFHDRTVEKRDDVVALLERAHYGFNVVGDQGELLEPGDYASYSSSRSFHNYLFTYRGPA